MIAKGIKKLTYIVLSIVSIFFIMMLSLYLVLKSDRLQQKLISLVTKNLSEKVNSKVSLDAVEWYFPNSFILKNMYIEDLSQDTLLFADRAKVSINIMQLFKSRVSFRTIQLTGMEAHINKNDSNQYNFQFFIDAFLKEEKDSTDKWSMDIESIAFDDCSVAYHNEPSNSKTGQINPQYIEISSLKGSLHVRYFSKDSINIRLNNVGFKELSGFELSSFSTTLVANREKLNMFNFAALMPNGRLSLNDATFLYGNTQAFSQFVEQVSLSLDIAPSRINLKDFAAFVPAFHSLDESLSLEGYISGTIAQLLIRNLLLTYGNDTKLQGEFSLNGLPDLEKLNFDANIREIAVSSRDIANISQAFSGKTVMLPASFDSLGVVNYKGNIKGSLTEMSADGIISSSAGAITTNVSMKAKDLTYNQCVVNGKVEAELLNLAKMFGTESEFENTTFNLKIELERRGKEQLSLNALGIIDSLVYKQYCYRDIRLDGKFDNGGFDGSLIMSDKNVELSFKGSIDWRKERPKFRFVANVQNAKLANLNLVTKYPNSSLSFNIETNLVGITADDMEGSFSIDNLIFANDDKEIFMNNVGLTIVAQENNSKKLSFYSDYINGSLTGQYQFVTILENLRNMTHDYLPSIIKSKTEKKTSDKKNDFEFRFKIDNTESINETIALPFVFLEEAVLSGFYNDSTNKFRVRIDAPQLRTGKTSIGDFVFLCENPRDHVKMMLRATHLPANRRRNPYFISLNSEIKQDSVNLGVHFSNSTEDTYSGSLSALLVLKDLNQFGLSSDIFINPTEVILNDTVWNIHKSKISIIPGRVEVDNFYFNHKNQFLKIDGSNSLTSKDSILVRFSDLQLGYISEILNQKDITFDGVSDGNIFLFRLLKEPYFKGSLNIYDASLNDYLIGDLLVNSSWQEANKCIAFTSKLLSPFEGKKSQSDIYGGIFIGNDSLFIEGKLRDVDLKFLRQYFASVMQNNTGTASGTVRAYGKFGHIGLEGAPMVRNMAFDINYLNTSYVLSDTVFMTPNSFRLNQTQVYDNEGNYGIASGLVLHDGFKRFKFAVDVSCSNLLALDTREEDNEMFYGKAYVGGKVNISGTPEVINFNLDLRTRPNTRITIPIESSSNVGNADFITFVESMDNMTAEEKRRARRNKIQKIRENVKSASEINMNINLDATPDAQVQLILDARQGDLIRATGRGNLRLTYNSKNSDFRMFGSYEINKGDYLFTIQSIIPRKFDIMEGSLLRWTGTPYDAFLDIKARYVLSVSLNEILEDPNVRTTLTPVHCLLNLTGTIRTPNIKLDLDLPNVDEEMRRQVRSIINTEEAMNRNIASLLALGHFYMSDRANVMTGSSELSSVGFSTLSSQISSWISKVNRDLNVGVNYRPSSDGGATSSEYDVFFSTPFLNDRLLINGNFGYREDVANSTNVSNNIIDFDLEYKLFRSGKLRLKGYNHTNNSYFKQAPNTQGIGLIYREDFDSFSGLMGSYLRAFKNIFTGSPKKPEEVELEEELR